MNYPKLNDCEVERLMIINDRRINHYISEISVYWKCDVETAMRIYCEAYYLMKGMPPMTAEGTVNCSWKRGIEHFRDAVFYPIVKEVAGFEAIPSSPRKIDLLSIGPTGQSEEPDQTLNNIK
jgi:hypothetical protein